MTLTVNLRFIFATLVCGFAVLTSPALFGQSQSVGDALLRINLGELDEAFATLEEMASDNDPMALLELSETQLDGHFFPIDLEKSQYYLDLAVVTGNQRALWSQAYRSGDIPRLRLLHEQGFSIAACSLTTLEPDLDRECYDAIKLLASTGDRHAIYALKAYRSDPQADALVEQFPYPRLVGEIAGSKWLSKPDPNALLTLVNLVELGSIKAVVDIVRPDFSLSDTERRLKHELLSNLEKPLQTHLKAVLHSLVAGKRKGWFGNQWSVNNTLGKLYLNGHRGLGIPSDYRLAFDAFQLCAESSSDTEANLCLYQQANIAEYGGANFMRDPAMALSLYRNAHQRGNYAASARLANFYRQGILGVEVDLKLAAGFSNDAVERGNRYEAFSLAKQYEQGSGVVQDLDEAARLYEIAATDDSDFEGSPWAMVELAKMHESGALKGANLDSAYNLYDRAAGVSDEIWLRHGGSFVTVTEQRRLAREGVDRLKERLDPAISTPSDTVRPSVRSTDFGQYRVLIIANQSYDHLTDLSTPRNDAALVGKVLENRFGASVEYLTDATRVEILSALNRYRRELTLTDNFILYYAGHGIYDEELKVGYWQPVDGTPDEDYTWIETDRVSRTLSGFQSRNALVIADSCYSGSVLRGAEPRDQQDKNGVALLALNSKKTRLAMTSGGLQPVLDAAGNADNSAFASTLVEIFKGIENPTTISSIFSDLRNSVTLESAAWGFEQIPELAPLYKAGHDGGDFILSPSVTPSN